MKPRFLALTLASAALLSLQVTAAMAAKKPSKMIQPETYSATEPGVVTITTTTAVPVQNMPAPGDSEEQEAQEVAPSPPPAPVEQTAPAVTEAPAALAPAIFDPVPSDQASLIAKRLPLVEKLMVKHGRAYDYRSHTMKQLEAILAELDAADARAQATGGTTQ